MVKSILINLKDDLNEVIHWNSEKQAMCIKWSVCIVCIKSTFSPALLEDHLILFISSQIANWPSKVASSTVLSLKYVPLPKISKLLIGLWGRFKQVMMMSMWWTIITELWLVDIVMQLSLRPFVTPRMAVRVVITSCKGHVEQCVTIMLRGWFSEKWYQSQERQGYIGMDRVRLGHNHYECYSFTFVFRA